ncbi:uncharacterized protein LOC111054057 [Nilaparvata lugens]|uniref:uncharacterized protein LOC111054057 n=1 Tax=Nilaparvata lugens TaxID=108931 RepID=UPI000B99B943|nr:uncharacterized protein LOC111054057 [Nilaparvata lugens]
MLGMSRLSASALLYLAIISCLVSGSRIQGVWLKMPAVVRVGSTVTLVCQFDLQETPLYAVKWYRGNYEFFRYMPTGRPPYIAFPIPGIDIDMSGSGAHQVTLRNVPLELSGLFKCEVTADAPFFSTLQASSNLTIIELGIRKPSVQVSSSVHRSRVNPLRVNCSAQQTVPPPNLTFYIDEKKVNSEYTRDFGPGLAGLEIQSPPWPHNQTRSIRCEATVAGVYFISSNAVSVKYDPQPTSGGGHLVSHLTSYCVLLQLLIRLFSVP